MPFCHKIKKKKKISRLRFFFVPHDKYCGRKSKEYSLFKKIKISCVENNKKIYTVSNRSLQRMVKPFIVY